MTEREAGVKSGEGCGGAVDGGGSEGVSGVGSTGRTVGAGEAGRVEGVEGLESPGHFWIMCPDCLHQKQSPFLVQRSHSLGVKGAR